MMNHQGGMGQLNCNENNQIEVNPQSIGALGLLPSASLLPGDDQRFPDRFLGSNHLPCKVSVNIVPNNDHSAGYFLHQSSEALGLSSSSSLTGNVQRFPDRLSESNVLRYQGSNNTVLSNGSSADVVPHNIDSDAEFARNNHNNNPNMTVGLCLNPYGPENQNTSNFSTTVIGSGVSGYIVEEQDPDRSSMDMRRLSCKRRFPEHPVREWLTGESSSTDARAEISKRQASEFNVNNNLNIPTPRIHPVCHQEHFETRTGHGTIRSVSDVQHVSETREPENFQGNILLRTAANQQASLPPSILSSRSVETPVGAISSEQQVEQVPSFHETLHAPPRINLMNPRSVSPSSLPVYATMRSGVMAPFHYPRNIPENITLVPQRGRGNWAHNAENLNSVNGTANFHGDFAYGSHYGSVSGTHPSNAPTGVTGFNIAEHHVQTPSRMLIHPVVPSTGFLRQSGHNTSNSNPSAASREVDFTIRFRESRASIHDRPPDNSIWSPDGAQDRILLMTELRSSLAHLHSGGPVRREDLMMLDHSIILHLLVENSDVQQVHLSADTMAYEELIALGEHIGSVNMGLSEETILSHLRQEIFQPIPEGSEENESCCICQEEYDGFDYLGKLDCGHRFHIGCIRSLLLQKNICPICKQIALAVPHQHP